MDKKIWSKDSKRTTGTISLINKGSTYVLKNGVVPYILTFSNIFSISGAVPNYIYFGKIVNLPYEGSSVLLIYFIWCIHFTKNF